VGSMGLPPGPFKVTPGLVLGPVVFLGFLTGSSVTGTESVASGSPPDARITYPISACSQALWTPPRSLLPGIISRVCSSRVVFFCIAGEFGELGCRRNQFSVEIWAEIWAQETQSRLNSSSLQLLSGSVCAQESWLPC